MQSLLQHLKHMGTSLGRSLLLAVSKELKEGGIYFGSQFEGTVPRGGKNIAEVGSSCHKRHMKQLLTVQPQSGSTSGKGFSSAFSMIHSGAPASMGWCCSHSGCVSVPQLQ